MEFDESGESRGAVLPGRVAAPGAPAVSAPPPGG